MDSLIFIPYFLIFGILLRVFKFSPKNFAIALFWPIALPSFLLLRHEEKIKSVSKDLLLKYNETMLNKSMKDRKLTADSLIERMDRLVRKDHTWENVKKAQEAIQRSREMGRNSAYIDMVKVLRKEVTKKPATKKKVPRPLPTPPPPPINKVDRLKIKIILENKNESGYWIQP